MERIDELQAEIDRSRRIINSLVAEREACMTRPVATFCERAQEVLAKYNVRLESAPADALKEQRDHERERCAKVVNDARFEGGVDLRSLVSRIKHPETKD